MPRPVSQVLFAMLAAAAWPACGGGGKPTGSAATRPRAHSIATKQVLAEARSLAREGDVDGADRAYGEAYADGRETKILTEHVEFLLQAGKPTRAQDVAKTYYDEHATDSLGYRLYSEALLAGNKGTEALEIADQLVALDAEDPVGHERRGRALILLDKSREAIEELRQAVQLDPKNATYHMALGTALHKLGDFDDAALAFRAALKQAPDDPQAHVLLGMALRDLNELDEARQYLDKALEIDSRHARAYFELGLLLNRQGKQADAEEALAKAVRYQPNESLFWYAYGEIYRLQGRTEEALEAYEKAMDRDPPYPKAVGKLGLLLVQTKRYDEAETVLIAGIRKDKSNAVNYLHLGVVYAAKGKNKLAIENYEKFLELAPKNDPERARAKSAIQELKRRGS